MRSLTIRCLIAALFLFFSTGAARAQTLFTYGSQSVSKDDFLKAYQKNNNNNKPTDQAYRDYLELYIRYKLKVQAAYDFRLDTLATQRKELASFRKQIADGYMNDPASLDALVNEAYERSVKDIHLAHIFIALPKIPSPADTLKAYQKIMSAYEALKNGKDFGETAALYSDDASAKKNHGDIGWITVFTLPYELETLAYSTAPAAFSAPYRSKGGYHIFKNLSERKAIGKVRVAHILLSFPPGASDSARSKIKLRADSIYEALLGGAHFSELAKRYSADNLTYQTGGEIPEFGVGKYDSAFETAAFAISQDSQLVAPVLTSYGYHIIRRIYRKEVPGKTKENLDALKQRVLTDPRASVSTGKFVAKIKTQTGFRRYPLHEGFLWAFTDSMLQRKTVPRGPSIHDSTVLLSFGKSNFLVKDWLAYIKGARNTPALSTGKTDADLFDKFIETTALTYYREHLEAYNKDFAYQLGEFRDGNLLFEVMQRQIWDKASGDSAGLKAFYDAHREKYEWQPGAEAVLFVCNNEKTAEDIRDKLQKDFTGWRKVLDKWVGSAQADSGRFEMAQLPMADRQLTAGTFTAFNTTPPDNTVSFAYIIRLHNEKGPRSFQEARGFVINDYQNFLEDRWIAALKIKYPVKVQQRVLSNLPK